MFIIIVYEFLLTELSFIFFLVSLHHVLQIVTCIPIKERITDTYIV